MWFKAWYLATVLLIAAVDGAFLGGIAAIITALGSIVLGLLAYRKGQQAGASPAGEHELLGAYRSIDSMRAVELDRLKVENDELRAEIERLRGVLRDRRSRRA